MGSQLVRFGQEGGVTILRLNPSSTANATPQAGYGNAGNDSGAVGFETIGFKEIAFQLVGAGATAAGYTVQIFCTLSPTLLTASDTQPGIIPYVSLRGNTTLIPATDWDPVPGPSEQGGTGGIANPLVSGGVKLLLSKSPFVAYRAVLTAIGAPTANCNVLMFGVA